VSLLGLLRFGLRLSLGRGSIPALFFRRRFRGLVHRACRGFGSRLGIVGRSAVLFTRTTRALEPFVGLVIAGTLLVLAVTGTRAVAVATAGAAFLVALATVFAVVTFGPGVRLVLSESFCLLSLLSLLSLGLLSGLFCLSSDLLSSLPLLSSLRLLSSLFLGSSLLLASSLALLPGLFRLSSPGRFSTRNRRPCPCRRWACRRTACSRPVCGCHPGRPCVRHRADSDRHRHDDCGSGFPWERSC